MKEDNEDSKRATQQLIEISSQKESEKKIIAKQLKEEKQKVENLEKDKKELLEKNIKLINENRRLERNLESYVDSLARQEERNTTLSAILEKKEKEENNKKENDDGIRAGLGERLREAEELFEIVSERNEELLAENTNLVKQMEEERNN